MKLIEKQQYTANLKFVVDKLIQCDGLLSQKEISNMLLALNYVTIHNNSLERAYRDLEYKAEQTKIDIKNSLKALKNL
jgi:hypothetical protein